VQRELAAYHGLMTHLDARIGDILAALDTSGEAEETYVIFLSDHGLALGSHGLLGKQNLYEHSMRAPLIIRGPGVPAGKESAALVYLHDVKPTIEELAGRPVAPLSPDETASRSLVPWWREPAAAVARSCLLLAFTDTMRAVRTSRWKLIRYPQTDQSQLFDLAADPHERHNLAARQPDELASLRQRLENAQRAAGDSLSWTADTVRPAFLDLTGHARDPFAGRPWDAPPR
jgi:arylsulfatase A-like enzyme